MAEFEVDQRFEYDAPTFVDFQLLQEGQLEDNDMDKWFDEHIDEETQRNFKDCFVPSSEKQAAEDMELKKEPKQGEEFGKAFMNTLQRLSSDNKCTASKGKGKRAAAIKARAFIKTSLNKLQTSKPTKHSESLTIPSTPEVMRKHMAKMQTKSHGLSTEELQMQEIALLKKEAKKKLRQSRKSFRMLAKSSGPIPVKCTRAPTEAVAFKFRSKSRDRSKQAGQQMVDELNPARFAMTLRSSNKEENYHPHVPNGKPPTPIFSVLSQPNGKPPTPIFSVLSQPNGKPPTPDGITKVKPFKFELDSRLPSKGKGKAKAADLPTAEAIQRFHKATPERFHSNPTSKKRQKSSSNRSLTIAKTPKLMSRERSRPFTGKSRVEEEEEEISRIKEYKFKARPLNPEVFQKAGFYGVPKKRVEMSLTVPQSPQLFTDERIKKSHKEEDQHEQPVFQARPVPRDIFERIKGVPGKRPRPLTCPESPALSQKRRRIEEPNDNKEEETDSYIIKATPLPVFEQYFRPHLPGTHTATQPFTFEQRYKDKPTRDDFIHKILQKEKKPDFRAQPMPGFGTPILPSKPIHPPTNPQPFNLSTETRGQQYSSKWIEKLAEEAEKAKQNAEFKAKEVTVLYTKPFIPQKSSKPLTDVSNAVLHSELQREHRSKYEAEKHERELALDRELLEREALREAEEAKSLAKYRKALVHKAQPIHTYAPIVIKPSDMPLTAPKTPVLVAGRRLRGFTFKTDV